MGHDKVLAQKAKDKWNKHGRNYDVIGYAFAPCVMTTYYSTLCWVCAGILGERGLGLVVHVPSGCVAKINIP